MSLVTGSTSSYYSLSLKLKYFVAHVYMRVCVCLLNYTLRTWYRELLTSLASSLVHLDPDTGAEACA